MASVFVDVQLSKAKLTLFHDGKCVVIASMVNAYCLQVVLLRVVVDGGTNLGRNASFDRRSLRCDIAFHSI